MLSTSPYPPSAAPVPAATPARWVADFSWAAAFFLPVCNVAFLIGGPYRWDNALLWTAPVWVCILVDWLGPVVAYRPPRPLAPAVYGSVLHALVFLQLAAILLMLRLASELTWNTPSDWGNGVVNLIAVRIVTGTNSCCSGIALAHELIHRHSPWLRWLGRLMLWTVLYDHFAIAHAREHHRHAATGQDCASARRGESFEAFWRRSVSGQFANAWKQECERMSRHGGWRLWAGNRVLQGLTVELLLLFAILLSYGPVALAIFVYQALVAVRLLEAVNYFQHWGLQRDEGPFGAAHAWSTASWWSLHSLLGLPLHADHHRRAGKPFFRLTVLEGSPRMPCGYYVAALFVRFANERYKNALLARLHCSRKGDQFFRPDADKQVRLEEPPG